MFESIIRAPISTSSGDNPEQGAKADTQGKCSQAQRYGQLGGNPGSALTCCVSWAK